ncbi:ATP-grasp domain-containing protein [Undibacterium sp. Dicai25W]|uniref:ATP-grasp domain-containing protein n=1 Tax=Undibacterium sp. Dicai25W TaxID=3413034 RepID=UPI003BF05BFF
MNSQHHYRVLIVTYAHWEGLSRLPALLHEAGCEISVLGVPDSFPTYSRFVKHQFISPNDVDAVVADLNVHLQGQKNKYDWIVIGDDPLLYALEKRRNEAWVKAIFPTIVGNRGIDFITSKSVFIQHCQKEQIVVPDFDLCSDFDELRAAGERLGYPIVLKDAQGFAGLAVHIVENEAALSKIHLQQQVIAQRFIYGRLASAAAIYREGKPIAWFSYYRSRTWGDLGPSAAIEFKVFPEIEKLLTQLGNLSGFNGLCGIDFIEQEETGQLVLLEQNFRPTLTMDLGRRVGVDFSKAIRILLNMDTSNGNHMPMQKEVRKNIVPLFPQDVFRAIDAKDHRGLLKWLWYPLWWREMRWAEPFIMFLNLRHIILKLRGDKKVSTGRFV